MINRTKKQENMEEKRKKTINGMIKQDKTKELGQSQNVGGSTDDWNKQPGGSTNDWTKQAEQYSKELGQSGGSANDWTKQADQYSKELGESGGKNVKETQWAYEAGQKTGD